MTEDIIKKAFETIDMQQAKTHTSQIPYIMQALKNKKIDNRKIEFAETLLKTEEMIIWSIDDTLDSEYTSKEEQFYSEITKFVGAMKLFEKILQYQLEHKAEFINVIIGKSITAEKMLNNIEKDIYDLVKIPYNERKYENKLLQSTDGQAADLVEIYQLNRTQNIKTYLGTAEAICDTTLTTQPFLYSRTVQLILEDLKEREQDAEKDNANIANILDARLKDPVKVKHTIKLVAERLLNKTKQSVTPETEFLVQKTTSEYQDLLKQLQIIYP